MKRFTISPASHPALSFDALSAERGLRRGQCHARGYGPRCHGGSNHHVHRKPAR